MAYKRKLDKDIRCPLEYGIDVFGGRWKPRILCVLAEGHMRYSELRHELVDITDTALAAALKELQETDMVVREQFEEIPPRVEYALTQKGKSTIPLLQAICKWSGIFYRDVEDNAPAKCQRCDFIN
ncbi:MAG: helix-turn-helix domain-containing protein [Coriobacteriales bacterium]